MLSTLQPLSCAVCLPDIHGFYEHSFNIVALNRKLLSMAIGHRQGPKLLAPGRVVILRDGVCFYVYIHINLTLSLAFSIQQHCCFTETFTRATRSVGCAREDESVFCFGLSES
jgi:hypothetical protein